MQTILMSNNFSVYYMYLSLDRCIAPTLSRIYAYDTIYLLGLLHWNSWKYSQDTKHAQKSLQHLDNNVYCIIWKNVKGINVC